MASDGRTDLGFLQAKRTGDDTDAGATAPSKMARLTSNTDAAEPSFNKAEGAATSSLAGDGAALGGQQQQQQQQEQQALLAILLPALSGTNPNLAAVACAAIAEMARGHTAAADAILQEPTVMQGLLRCIEQTRSREAGATAIAVLASNASTSVLEKDTAINALIDQCCSSRDASALEHILHSLSKLSTTQPGAKLLLQHTALLAAIARHLDSSAVKVAELAAIILGDLMQSRDGVQAVAQLHGSAKALARHLGSSDEGVAVSAAKILACLAAVLPLPQSMLSDDVVTALSACLTHSSAWVAERAADSIALLAVNDTANSMFVEQGNLPDALLKCLKSGNYELAGQAAWAVSHVALSTAGSQLFLQRTDITETLLCLVSRDQTGVCEAAVRALRHLACDMGPDDTFWQQPRTWLVLRDALSHRHETVVEDAARVVEFWANVTTYHGHTDLQFGTIGPLLRCLNHARNNVVIGAAKTLSLMAETDDGCDAILQQAGAVPMVLACTTSGDPRIAKAACTLLAYIADSGLGGVHAIEEEPGAIKGLVHCLRFEAAAKAAGRALRNITEESDASFDTMIEAVTELCGEVQAAREKGSLEDITRNLQQAIVGAAQHLRS